MTWVSQKSPNIPPGYETSTHSRHITSKGVTSSSNDTSDADSQENIKCSNGKYILGGKEKKKTLLCLTHTLSYAAWTRNINYNRLLFDDLEASISLNYTNKQIHMLR